MKSYSIRTCETAGGIGCRSRKRSVGSWRRTDSVVAADKSRVSLAWPHSQLANYVVSCVFGVGYGLKKGGPWVWNAIVSNGGEERVCGWCKDKWGLSWKITPLALTRAITDPDTAPVKRALAAMMQMKKIDIAAIEAA